MPAFSSFQGRCDVNLKNNRNQTPLHLAVTQGHMGMVQLLVSEGCDVNAEDEDGDTAMHIVLERQHLMSIMAEDQQGGEEGLLAKVRRDSSEQALDSVVQKGRAPVGLEAEGTRSRDLGE